MTKKDLNITLVIPSLDPDEKFVATVNEAIENGFSDIILVDDGSHEENKKYFDMFRDRPEVEVLTHEVNFGKGAALKTAFSYFLKNRPNSSGVITADGDGQHRTSDIIKCSLAMEECEEPTVILGCRNFSLPHVPKRSRFGNKTTSAVFRIFCGMKISDTQTGLRAIPRELVPRLITAKGTRYEYETNMLLMLGADKLPYKEVEIETVYYGDNEQSHFRPIRDSIRVYGLIVKYLLASLSSSLVDLLAFFLLSALVFKNGDTMAVLLSTVIARVISMTFNFAVNKAIVFENSGNIAKTFAKYLTLAVFIMASSWLLVSALTTLLFAHSAAAQTLIKAVVDGILFLVSFRAQRAWVFKNEKK